jgi:hypothetical protein
MLRAKIDLRQPIFLLKFTEDRDRFKVQETPGSQGFSMELHLSSTSMGLSPSNKLTGR